MGADTPATRRRMGVASHGMIDESITKGAQFVDIWAR